MLPDISLPAIIAAFLLACAIGLLIGRALRRDHAMNPGWVMFDIVAASAGCMALIVIAGLRADTATVLAPFRAGDRVFRFLWSHLAITIVLGAIAGVILFHAVRWTVGLATPGVDTSRFAAQIASRRRGLSITAATGCALTMVTGCYRLLWSAGGAFIVGLAIGAVTLDALARKAAAPDVPDHRDWLLVPRPLRAIMMRGASIASIAELGIGILTAAVLIAGHSEPLHGRYLGTLESVTAAFLVATVYGLDALFFRYGELRGFNDRTCK